MTGAVERAATVCAFCAAQIGAPGGGLWRATDGGIDEVLCAGHPIACQSCAGRPGCRCVSCAATGREHRLGAD
jgi:hypothetical protein